MNLRELLKNARDTHRALSTISTDLERVATQWANLDGAERVELGKTHPDLVDALINIESRWTKWEPLN